MDNKAREGILCLGRYHASRLVLCPPAAGFEGVWGGCFPNNHPETELPENEWVTSTYDKKIKKTIGKIFADLQITRFNVNSQPYYVLLDTNGNLLTKPRAYDLNIDAFVKFLGDGLANFSHSAHP